MFRIELECFVDDKNLPKLHWALNGLVYDLKLNSQPVANAVGKRGKLTDATGGNGDIVGVLKAYLKKNKMKSINAAEAKAFQRHIGRSEQGYSALLSKAQDAGLLKRSGKGTKTGYTVMEAK
jgi:hypothetical protein